MSALTKVAFMSKWATLFATNGTRDISGARLRDFREDIADSFINVVDTPSSIYGGTWAFPAGAFPTATYAGTLYIATADKGVPGDADYVQSGTWFVSLVNGANTYAQFSYKP